MVSIETIIIIIMIIVKLEGRLMVRSPVQLFSSHKMMEKDPFHFNQFPKCQQSLNNLTNCR